MPKISVIIPIYGVEKYIERCSRSLFEQTLDDIEYIFVDDASPDNSIAILENVIKEYPNRINHIKILHHQCNKGLPQARFTGTKSANGRYIAHCDSDDYLDVTMYEYMYKKAEEGDYDMVLCDYATVNNGVVSSMHCPLPNTKHDCISLMLSGKFPSYMWNKLVKRQIYQKANIEWPTGNMWEDMATMIQLVQYTNSIAYIDKPLYYYEIRNDSIMRRVDKNSVVSKWKQVRDNVDIIFNHIDKGTFKKECIVVRYRERNHLTPLIADNEVWDLYKSQYKGLNMSLLLSNQMSVSQFFKAFLYSNKYLHKFAFKYFSAYNR